MVHSLAGGTPAKPTTQTALRAHRKRRREAWPSRASAKTTHGDGLDWDGFRDLYYPDSRRHNLEAIVAYGAYKKSSPVAEHMSEPAHVQGDSSADAASLDEWEDEGGASH
jgi:hypothetical protein